MCPPNCCGQDGDGWVAGMDTAVGCDPPFLSDVVEDGWIMSREGRYMPAERPRVLISGASVAGPVLAFWLHRCGFRPTVIEQVAELRVGGGGHAVDLFGPVVELMDWMGVLPEVERARTQTEVIALVRPGGRPVEV